MSKVILVLIMAGVVAIVVLAFIDQAINNNAVNTWTARCNRDGGVVQVTSYGLFSNDLECIKDGNIIDHQN